MTPEEKAEILDISEKLQRALDNLEQIQKIIPVIDDMACRLKLLAMCENPGPHIDMHK